MSDLDDNKLDIPYLKKKHIRFDMKINKEAVLKCIICTGEHVAGF